MGYRKSGAACGRKDDRDGFGVGALPQTAYRRPIGALRRFRPYGGASANRFAARTGNQRI